MQPPTHAVRRKRTLSGCGSASTPITVSHGERRALRGAGVRRIHRPTCAAFLPLDGVRAPRSGPSAFPLWARRRRRFLAASLLPDARSPARHCAHGGGDVGVLADRRAVDCVWLLGPSPFAIVFAVLATLRRKQIVLGVRQDYPTYVRARLSGRRGIRDCAVIDLAFRGLARLHPVIVVGRRSTRSIARPGLLEIAVSPC